MQQWLDSTVSPPNGDVSQTDGCISPVLDALPAGSSVHLSVNDGSNMSDGSSLLPQQIYAEQCDIQAVHLARLLQVPSCADAASATSSAVAADSPPQSVAVLDSMHNSASQLPGGHLRYVVTDFWRCMMLLVA